VIFVRDESGGLLAKTRRQVSGFSSQRRKGTRNPTYVCWRFELYSID